MKFTDGYWQMRKGVVAQFAAEAADIEIQPDSLTVFAPTKRIEHRGDTLNRSLLTVCYSSPMANVIRVQIVHHMGIQSRPPEFPLNFEPTEITAVANNQAATFRSGDLSVKVAQNGEWDVSFCGDGRLLTSSGWRSVGIMDTDSAYTEHSRSGRYIHEQLNLGVGETVYGLGERFTPFVKNGQTVDIWNEDGGTASEQTYKNIPFYLTNRGYGIFVNHPEHVSFEVASEKVTRVQFSVPGESLDYFVIYGPTPKEILQRYTALTGRPALPPAWSFGLWLSTSFTTDYDEKTVTGFIQGMADRDIPLHVFHFDCFWMKGFHWSNFLWDDEVFPDPAGMLQRLKERGLHICVWINPYIAQRSELFVEAMQNGYLLKRPNGDIWQWDMWQAGMGIVDFTNPEACAWFADKLRVLTDTGVDSFKTDFGERIPTDVVYWDGSDPQKMHNFYPYLYNKTVFELLKEVRGEGDAVVFARSATAGCQQFPVHWGGDCTATFESMAESLRGGLSLALSGFGFWSHDIGGFENSPSPAVYKRWCAFGLLSTHSRLHGSGSYRVPWLVDEESVAVLRFFTKLKCRLMPYLFQAAQIAHETGIPVMRAMMIEFPNDPACEYLDRQYMLGDSLLVAPVFTDNGTVSYYVPEGQWTDFLTGEVIEGPKWVQTQHDFMRIPLLVRPGSVIPVGNVDNLPNYDYGDGVTLRVYGLEDGDEVTAVIPTLTGDEQTQYIIKRKVDKILIKRRGVAKRWKLQLVGIQSVTNAEPSEITSKPEGILLRPNISFNSIQVQI